MIMPNQAHNLSQPHPDHHKDPDSEDYWPRFKLVIVTHHHHLPLTHQAAHHHHLPLTLLTQTLLTLQMVLLMILQAHHLLPQTPATLMMILN